MNDYEFEPGYEHLKKTDLPEGIEPYLAGQTLGSGQAEANAYNLKRYMERVREEQNLLLGIAAGAAAAVLGAVVWALITYFSEYQIGWIAILVGYLVGFGVRTFGKGIDQIYGAVGGGFALFGIVAGNLLATALFIAKFESVPIFDVLLTILLSPALAVELMTATFSPIDLLFYALAIYQGFKLSFRRITQKDIDTALGTGAPVSFS